MNQLDKILETKRTEVERRKAECSIDFLKSFAMQRHRGLVFVENLRAEGMGVIAEIKRRSPSAGDIRPDLRADHVAEQYELNGAQAVSILADKTYFGAEESDFTRVAEEVALPILYKEFVVDEWQVWHAASLGASAVLLIAAALGEARLRDLLALATAARLEALVEVHTADEMQMARAVGAVCIGVNNRDLTTMRTDLATSLALVEQAPPGAVLVSESGIREPGDVTRLRDAGYDAILVGEQLLKQENPGAALKTLMSEVWASS